MKKAAQSQTPGSETVMKTLGLLDLFCKGPPAQSASEIAKRANLPLSTAYRLLTTLTRVNFIEFDIETKKYKLGLKLLELGYIASQQLNLPSMALPVLNDMMLRSSETAHLSIRDGNDGVFISKVEALQNIRMHTPLGRRVPLHAGASMKIMLAFLSKDEIEQYLDQPHGFPLADNTITTRDKLREDLERIREQGYAVSFSEQSHGSAGVAAPVRDHSGKVVAGLTISGPEQRFTAERVKLYIELTTEGAGKLSQKLGWKRQVADFAHES